MVLEDETDLPVAKSGEVLLVERERILPVEHDASGVGGSSAPRM